MNDIARPINPAPLAEANIYEACRAFVLTYVLPALEPANVFQGWQNRAALPQGTNDYAVISVLSAAQRGTTIESFAGESLFLRGLLEVQAQVDFSSEDDTARQRAARLATVARSSPGRVFSRIAACRYCMRTRSGICPLLARPGSLSGVIRPRCT